MGCYQDGMCGQYCGKCQHYGVECMGCTYKPHLDCYFVRCCLERRVEHCGVCAEFPCTRLREFCPEHEPGTLPGGAGKLPGGRVENLRARMALGTETWLRQQRERYGN